MHYLVAVINSGETPEESQRCRLPSIFIGSESYARDSDGLVDNNVGGGVLRIGTPHHTTHPTPFSCIMPRARDLVTYPFTLSPKIFPALPYPFRVMLVCPGLRFGAASLP